MPADIAVVGGRGKTGRVAIQAVHAHRGSARSLGRAELREPVASLKGCSAIYLIAPNMHPDESALVADVLAAAKSAGIERVVYHSVAAPYVPEMPHHLGKAEAERLIRTSGLAWTILQPCAYIQNFVPALAEADPVLSVAYDPDQSFGFVDLADVGEIAAQALLDESFIGSTLELGGPALVSVRDVASAASEVLGREVPVHRITSGDWAEGPGAHLDPREQDWLVGMFDYYNAHGLPSGPWASRAVLGREPHSVAEVLRRELALT